MPRACQGTIEGARCCFSHSGGPSQPKPGQSRCSWCLPVSDIKTVCSSAGGRARLAQLLRRMPEASCDLARRRLPADIYNAYFVAEFGPQDDDVNVDVAETSDVGVCSDSGMDSPLEIANVEADAGDLLHSDGWLLSSPQNQEADKDEETDASEIIPQDRAEIAKREWDEELPSYAPEPFENSASGDEIDSAAEHMKRPAAQNQRQKKCYASRKSTKKKPAARKGFPGERCLGKDNHPCVFSTTQAGMPATIHSKRGQVQCMFCSLVTMEKALSSSRPKVIPVLRKLFALDHALGEKALNEIEVLKGAATAHDFRMKLGKAIPKHEWSELLENRKLARAPLDAGEVEQYDRAVRQDRQRARRKVLLPECKGKHSTRIQEAAEMGEVEKRFGSLADLAENDVGLPAPGDPISRMVEQWCKQGSWGICEQCRSLQPLPLRPIDLKRSRKPTISANMCTACAHGEYVPCLEDVPVALRSLSPSVVTALRPLDIDTGALECLIMK